MNSKSYNVQDDSLFSVAIVGSRDVEDGSRVREVMDRLVDKPSVEVVSGGQPKGVDGIVDRMMREEAPFKDEFEYTVFPPMHYDISSRWWTETELGLDVSEYGGEYRKKNYYLRNLMICRRSDKMVAIKKRKAENKGTSMAVRMFEQVNGTKAMVIEQ